MDILDKNAKITPENCANLKDILDMEDGLYKEFYESTKACVEIVLASRIPQRWHYAAYQLRELYGSSTRVCTIEQDGIIWTHLSVAKDKDFFFFVGRYRDNVPLEIAPKEEEIKSWRQIGIEYP